jgi:hypothetical protein
MVEVKSIIDMPSPKSKQALEKFKGYYTKVSDFIREYQELYHKNNVISDKNKRWKPSTITVLTKLGKY